ncbi:MAG: hypothetical protein HY998_04185 [candidate division NC10 bacterium]|nr:hypothetical protein [candidate division NC10 bacterium]
MIIDANGLYYRELNRLIREAVAAGETRIHLFNVNGQRYIGDGLKGRITITIDGIPGHDLAAFMNGPTIVVNNNAQDGVGNTMNDGKVVVRGNAGDVLGYGMRGGKLFVQGDVGYRVGIHMKSYKSQVPVIIAGGAAADFFGEYMAGGIMVLLGLNGAEGNRPVVGDYLATGMHGGVIYIRGTVEEHQLGKEVGVKELEEEDYRVLRPLLEEYCQDLDLDIEEVFQGDFIKLLPVSHRPYGALYALNQRNF